MTYFVRWSDTYVLQNTQYEYGNMIILKGLNRHINMLIVPINQQNYI